MATIKEAMSNSAKLLDAAARGEIEPAQLQEEVTSLLAANLSARGFMAALATGDLPADQKIRTALLAGIKAGKANAYELIVKNIIMSGCAEQEHAQKERIQEAQASKAACTSSLELARLLDDDELRALAREALDAIEARAAGEALASIDGGAAKKGGASGTTQSTWHQFFDRWGYTSKMLAGVEESLAAVAGET